jgi:hypothetical protein
MELRRCREALFEPHLFSHSPIPDNGGKGLELHQGMSDLLSHSARTNYEQMINAGERLIVNNRSFGYLSNRIVFYLLNLHIKSRRTYFARVGHTLPMRLSHKMLTYYLGWCFARSRLLQS